MAMRTRQVIQNKDSNNVVWFGSKAAEQKLFINSETVSFVFNDTEYVFDDRQFDGRYYFKLADNISIFVNLYDNNNCQLYTSNDEILRSLSEENSYELRAYDNIDAETNVHTIVFDLYSNDVYYQRLATYLVYDIENITLISGSIENLNVCLRDLDMTFEENGKIYEKTNAIFVNDEGDETDKKHSSSYSKEVEAVRQHLLQHLSVIQHELWYNYLYGLPLTTEGVTKAMIDAEAISIISSCQDVKDIKKYDSHLLEGHEYVADIYVTTIYGDLSLSI